MLEDIIAEVERSPITQQGETAPNHPLENIFAQAEGRAPISPVKSVQPGQAKTPTNRSPLAASGSQSSENQKPGFFRELGKGAISGWEGANKAVNDLLEYTGTLTGSDTLKDIGKTGSEYWGEKVKANAPRVQNFTDLDWSKPRDVLDWAAWNIGQMGGQMAVTLPFMAMGGAGAAAKGTVTAGQALKGLFSEGDLNQAGKFLAQWAKPKAMDIPIGIMEAGSVAEGQLERLKKGETEELDPIRGLAAAFVATKLEELGAEGMVNRLFAKGTTGVKGQLFKKIGQQALATGFGEGAEEFFQAYAEKAGINPAELATKDMFMEAVNGAAAGAVGGAAMGAGGGAYSHHAENKAIEKIKDVKPAYVSTEELPAIHRQAMELSESRPGDQELAALRDSYATEIEKRKGDTSDAREELLKDEDQGVRSQMTAKDILNAPAEKSEILPAEIPGVDAPAETGIDVQSEEDLTPDVMAKLDQTISDGTARGPMETQISEQALPIEQTQKVDASEITRGQAEEQSSPQGITYTATKGDHVIPNVQPYNVEQLRGMGYTLNKDEPEIGGAEKTKPVTPDAAVTNEVTNAPTETSSTVSNIKENTLSPQVTEEVTGVTNVKSSPSVTPDVGSTVSWATGKGNSLSGTITKLDDGRVTVKTDAGKTYSLNPAKAKGFTITDRKGESINGEKENTAVETGGATISDGAKSGGDAPADLKIAGTKGKRGPRAEEAKQEGQGEKEVKPPPQSQSFTERMKNAETADEGRRLISEYQEEFASIEKAAGLRHTIGTGGSVFAGRGYSTLTAGEKKNAIRRVSAKNAELGKKLSDLINDIDESEPHWKALYAKSMKQPFKGKEEGTNGTPLMDGSKPNEYGVFDKQRGVEAIAYEGKKASATIHLAQLQNGKWISAYAEEHKHGSFAGGSSPLTANEQFNTREEAVAARARRIAENEKRIAADSSSVVTPQERKEATKMAQWAEGLIGKSEIKEEPAEIKAAGTGGKSGPKEKAEVKQEAPAREPLSNRELTIRDLGDVGSKVQFKQGTNKTVYTITEINDDGWVRIDKEKVLRPVMDFKKSEAEEEPAEIKAAETGGKRGPEEQGAAGAAYTLEQEITGLHNLSAGNFKPSRESILDAISRIEAAGGIVRHAPAKDRDSAEVWYIHSPEGKENFRYYLEPSGRAVLMPGAKSGEPETANMESPVSTIDDEIKNTSMEDIDALIDEVIADQAKKPTAPALSETERELDEHVSPFDASLIRKATASQLGIEKRGPLMRRALVHEEPAWTNGKFLEQTADRLYTNMDGKIMGTAPVDASAVWDRAKEKADQDLSEPPVALWHYDATETREEENIYLFLGDAETVLAIDKRYYDHFALRYPDLKLKWTGGKRDSVTVYSGSKMVGMIMPIVYNNLPSSFELQAAMKRQEKTRPLGSERSGASKTAAPKTRSLDSILADATKEGFGGAAEAIKGLYELFGGGSLKSFPGGFDADTYAKAKPHFEVAMEHMRNAGKGLKEFVSFFVERLGATVKPYLMRYLQDLKGVEATTEEWATPGAENSTSDAETKNEDAEEPKNLDENTGKGEKGSRKRLTAEEKAEREAKRQVAKEKKEKKAALGNFQNVGYVYDPEKINQKIKDKPLKSAAKILLDEMAPAKVWNIQFAEDATPGMTRMLDQVQKYFASFKDFLTEDYSKLKRYAFKRKAEDAVNYWLEEDPGNIDQLKAWAEEYGKALQPLIDAFKGQSNIMRTINRLQSKLLDGVRRNVDGTFPEYYEARSSLTHPSFNRDLFTASGTNVRYFYDFLTKDYQKLLDAETDILLSEININKRTRNQTVVRIGLPDYREGVDLQRTEDFQESFGFNGVGFGEQGWINQEERHRVVNAAYDAFKDLAATIGATEKGMSLGGGLAVQFANLGHKAKGAAAAFFPDIRTINFTRDHGDGTMAHEWGHALHYMAAPETIEEINSVIQTMKFIYDFEAGTRMVDDLLAKDSPFLKRILSSKRQQRIEAVKAEAERRFRDVVKKETDYFSTAKEMDADYTARETEMWARAFEAYLFDTMTGTNNYLVNDFVSAGRVGGRSGVGTKLVYPAGLERETFNATIKHFLEGLTWDENGLPHLKEGYETIEQLNERLLDEKLKELQDSVEERYKAIWSSEPSADGHYWYQYDETAFGPMMQPDGYAAYDKGYKGAEQNGSGAVGYLTQLNPDAILDYKLSNIQYEGENATYISDVHGGINNALEEDGAEALEGELPGGKRKNDQAGDIRSDERGGGEGGEGRTHSPSKERDSAGGAKGAGDSGILAAAAPGNYRITDLTLTDPKPVTERFNRNLAAIKVLKTIESEDRSASPGVTFIGEEPPGGWTEADKVSHKYDKLAERGNEKEILAQYTGWGGMAELFAWEPVKTWAGKAELLKAELDKNEIRGAESSSTSSYYTPVPVAQFMWKLVRRLGFERGVVLDPATGASGLFFGTMPGELQQNVALQGVEMDGLSARIASKLYELAAIDNKPFQEVKKPNNRYDLTITNVPFEGITPSDPKHNKGQYLLHNYFINKMLDLTAPGALSMMITTSNTMDKAGAHLKEYAKKADFVGAIRLPSGIYSATGVVTDILVFRKKIEGSKFQGIPAEEWTTTGTHESTGLEVNNYFLKHPEMIAGKLEMIQGRWGDDNIRVVGEGDLQTNLERLAAAFPAKIVEREAIRELKSIDDIIAAPGTVKEGGLYINGKGEACLKVEGEEEKLPTATAREQKRAGIAKQYVKILDQVRTVLRAQKTGAEEAEIKAAQKQLKKEYDDFVKKYGPVNKTENYDVYSEATDSDWVVALEDYDPDTGKVVKLADIFTKDITISGQTPTRADTDHDALAMSLNEFGYPNLEYMAKLRGSDVETVMKGVAYKIVEDPETGFLVTMDEYLSGNVKHKLLVAREMAGSNPEYERNVKLLEAAQPDEIPAHRITARIGASWVDPQHLSDYVTEKLDMEGFLTTVFSFSPITNEWTLSFKGRPSYKGKHWGEENKAETERQIQRFRNSVEATRVWGTNRRDFIALIQDAISGKRPEVHYTGDDGKRYLDEVATQAAENKLQEIQSDFGRWLFDEPGRADAAVKSFNDLINTSIPPKADGSHLTFPGKSLAVLTQKEKEELGMTEAITFYPHQPNTVWKYIRGGNIYLAHEVGAGKTMTMALLAMEAKRLRGKKKVLYVTLNDSTMGQAVAEIKKLYPLANVLQVRVSTQELRKRRALQKLAMNDFDIAIMRQQDLDRIALSPEAETVFIEEELQEYREILEEAKRNNSRILEQQIQQAIHALEEKLKAPGVHDEAKRKNLFFDDLGIDLMIVDEAHRYKNVPYATRLNRITGLNPAGSPTAKAFFRKTQYMNAQYPRQDGVVLASGTALSNSIAEFYNIQRMLQPKEVKRQGVWSFDRWIANYGDMGSQLEWDGARGQYKNITTNRKIVNAGRLLATAYQNIDCVRAEDTPIRRPKIRGGEPQRIKIQSNQYVEDYKQIVLERCREIEHDPRNAMFEGVPDNMLRVISNMSKVAIDQRLDSRYKNTELQEDSKIYRASRLIRRRWEEETEHKGVQVVFADIGIPKRYLNFKYKTDEELEKLTDEQREKYAVKKTQYENSANQFSTYDGLKDELIKLGIPAEQIAFIHDADDTNKDKKAAKLRKLFKKVNEGEIRVLIGSTDKAGTGVNIQRRISDIHHLDVWWNYSSWEQRNGRAIRAGNIYTDMEGVYIHNYVTETTVDATRWDKIFAKGKVLNATLGGDINLDVIEDISEETMSAKMMAAEASGNPLMAKQATLLQQVQSLRFEQSSFLDNVRRARMDLAATPDRIATQEKYIEDYKASRAIMEKVTAVRFAGDSRTLTLEKHGKEIAETLKKAIEKDPTAWDPGRTAPLLVFGAYTATERTIEENGKPKKVKEYNFIPLTAKAEVTGADGDPYARVIVLSGGIMNSEKPLAEIRGKGKNATVDVKANISRTVTEYLTRLDNLEDRANDSIKELREDEPKFQKIAETPWAKADELEEKAKELAEVEREMAAQGQAVGNPETGVPINLFKGTVPILEDIAGKHDWNITREGIVYPGEYDPAIAIRKNVDLNKFSDTKTKFKPSFASSWNSPDQISAVLADATKPETPAMKPVAYTTVGDATRFWMNDKFTIRGSDAALSVDEGAWRFLERVVGTAGTWHPEEFRGSVFLVHVGVDGQRDAMIAARAERGKIPAGVAELMKSPEAPQYKRSAIQARGMSSRRVQSIVDKATFFLKGAPKVHVVQHVSECPIDVLQDMEKNGILDENGDADVQGFSWNGQVWLVSDNINSAKEAAFILMHELAHDGLGTFLRKNSSTSGLKSIRTNYNSLMDAIYQAHKKEVLEIARTTHTHLDLSKISGCRQAAEEWLCNQAYEAQSKWYDRFVAIFNDLLRAIGIDVKLSDAEVRTVLRDAFKSFGESEDAARYMVAAWHGSRNIFDRFDLGKASTGAYGYGMYFSSMKEIGELYQEGGSLYQVTLTPDESDFLDWDRPLNRQSDEVLEALEDPEVQRAIDAYEDVGDYVDTGRDLYIALMIAQGGGAEASRFLNSIGVPGIKYYEMGVSDKGKSGFNYVLFDDSQVNIEARYPHEAMAAGVRDSRNFDYDLVKGNPKYSRHSKEEAATSLFPEVEKRIREAKGIKHPSIKDRARELLGLGWQEMTRHFPHLDAKTQGKTIEVLRQFQEVPVWAKQKATDKLDEFIGKLSPDDRHVFGMNLILADMLRDLDSGLLEPHPEDGLPFGYKDRNQVRQDLDHFSAVAENRPEIQKALQKRNDYMGAINDQMIALKILPKDLANDPAAYFHHQVLAYLNYQSENKGLGISARDVKRRRKGWQFSRQGSVKDYNTEYVEAEFEVLSQALAQIATVETINKIDKLENVKRSMEDKAKRENMKAFWSQFDPLDDPLKPYKTRMAMSFARLQKLTELGEIYYPPEFEDLREHIEYIAENKQDFDDPKELYAPHPKMFAFLSYLVNHGDVGAVPAATILKAIGERNKFIRDTVGEKNWRTFWDFIPEGYLSYKPDAHPAFYFANSIQDQVLEQVLSGNRNLQDRDVKAVLAKARDAEWIVPEGVAQTLNEFRPATENSLVGKLSADTLSMWKQWTLMNPFRVFRYNLNNMSGDLDIVMAYDPKIITQYMMQAFKDLKAARKGMEPGKLKDELDQAMQKGVIGSGITQWEIPELSDVRSVKNLVDYFDGKSGNTVTKVWNFSKSVTTLRENILRLAAYRYFKDQLARGGKGIYAASNKEEIDQITDMDERSAKLARELLGDYGNVSHAGQYIRKRIIPFYSWMEINAPRYVRLFRNVKHEGGGYGGMASVTAWKAAKLGVKAMALMGMVMLWNATFFPDEEDELQETGRDQLHLILGRREDGSIMTIRFQGALSDALSWFGMENPVETIRSYMEGRKSEGDIAKDVVKAAPTKLFHGLRPEPKLLYEVFAGQSFYPDPTKPRPIHDTMEHVLRTFSLDKTYNLAVGKPRPNGSIGEQLLKDISGLLVNTSDPGEKAYYTTRKYVYDWLDKQGKEKPTIMPTNKSNALYYYKQALKFSDFDAAGRYLKKYKDLGGKEINVRDSIKKAAPLASLKLNDRYDFKKSLSLEQQETMRVAMEWYKKNCVEARRSEITYRTH